jgi:hypothetical protein
VRKLAVAVIAGLLLLNQRASFAQSELAFVKTCPFSKGDSVTKVKEFYGIASDPQKTGQTLPGTAFYQYYFPQYGVWVFLDDHLLILSLRFDRPFSGKIGGIAVGDRKEDVRLAKGEPARQFQGFLDSDAMENRKQRKQDILSALPDPTPKKQVLDAFAQITRIDELPSEFAMAWVYNPGQQSFVRYDIGATSNKVQVIIANSCAAEK